MADDRTNEPRRKPGRPTLDVREASVKMTITLTADSFDQLYPPPGDPSTRKQKPKKKKATAPKRKRP